MKIVLTHTASYNAVTEHVMGEVCVCMYTCLGLGAEEEVEGSKKGEEKKDQKFITRHNRSNT